MYSDDAVPKCLSRQQTCKLCSVGELHERLDSKPMEIKWNKYKIVDP